MSLSERIRDRIDEFLPFKPEVPVDILLPEIAAFLENELGKNLLFVIHLGSTAETPKNITRPGYKPPHRNSDVDILAVIRADLNPADFVEVARKLKKNPISKVAVDLRIADLGTLRRATIEGHPALLYYAHAKEYGHVIKS